MLVEALAAVLILTVGVMGLLTGFVASQKLSSSSERQASMSQVAQRELERVQGLPYASVGLTAAPSPSTDPGNPDYWVTAGPPATFAWNQGSSPAEALDVDTTNGTVVPSSSWSEGGYSGTVDDFVTWVTDTGCSPGCPASADYKRVTVAVTMTGPGAPSPVYVSAVVTDPNAAPNQGTANGTSGNPVTSGGTTCSTQTGTTTTTGPCEAPITSGVPNTFYVHDCAATNTSCGAPTTSHPTDPTVGLISGLTCSSTLTLASEITSLLTSGCPTPDLMDTNIPTGTNSTLQYSTDLGTTGYQGGRLLQPLCGNTSGCGTGSTSDCSSGASWSTSLLNAQNEMWVTAPLATQTTLTGTGALNLFTQTQGGASAVITLCVEVYAIPPSGGIAGSLADLFSWPPTALGGDGYVAATDPSTGANWPTSPSNVEYSFNYASGGVTVPAGDRIGLRVWMAANVNDAIALLYDSAQYPTELQLNSSSAISFTSP
ncbi:hypothetical protein [Conexibacter sp. DBS9H8]|uniref:hypothetical protein n=1 Tax=Conexibacter sp. DBS9H8 TaxID=2937801 RepID=UPI002010BDA1|nr:hypothetical protein [Conexibacter sp. DBS9H8]